MPVYAAMRVLCPQTSEESIRSPRAGISDACDSPMLMLGTEPRSSAGAGSALDYWSHLSVQPEVQLLKSLFS